MTERMRMSLCVAGVVACLVTAGLAVTATGQGSTTVAQSKPNTTCQLGNQAGQIRHVIYIQFDNVHFIRDLPNVPSDLEQMPHLVNFIRDNGTLLTNDHTVLASNTATGILSSLTGVYPDRMGQPVSNSFRYFTPSGSTRPGVAFAYWTAPLFDPLGPTGQTDFTPEMINENGKIAPAPWVPFTRAGCDFGSVAMANTILENTAIDIPTVFGAGSLEAAEVALNPGQAFADFVGIGIHCAQGSPRCSTEHSRPDLLPDEPGGYSDFSALFGAKYVDPAIGFSTPTDLDGRTIQDASGHVGFPGFDGMEPTVSLSWVAKMQEAGIPVTYAYISDAHDGHGTAGNIHFSYGPGEAGYVQQLQDYDRAFQIFFDRLAADGITKENTLFVFTVDEGDHFVGSAPTPAGCDGVRTPCTYARVGEINVNLAGLLATEKHDTTPFSVHSDVAPTIYVTGNPTRVSGNARPFERNIASLTATNPYTGLVDKLTVALADPVEETTLHMVTADPSRTPTFTMFGAVNYFFFADAKKCITDTSPCVTIPPRSNQSFAWSHGGIQDEIASTWVGYVGPGIRHMGEENDVWTDHTDLRPTILTLVGLKDDYRHDGRVVVEFLFDRALPQTLIAHRETLLRLGAAYKQLNASFGSFAMDTLRASTRALAANDSGDATYKAIEGSIENLTSKRDTLATVIKKTLDAAAFQGEALNEQQAIELMNQAQDLLEQAAQTARR